MKPGVVLDVVAGIAATTRGQIGHLPRGRGARGEHGREGKGAVHARDDEYAGRGLPGGDGDCARGAHDRGRFRKGATDFLSIGTVVEVNEVQIDPRHGAGGERAGVCLHGDRSAGSGRNKLRIAAGGVVRPGYADGAGSGATGAGKRAFAGGAAPHGHHPGRDDGRGFGDDGQARNARPVWPRQWKRRTRGRRSCRRDRHSPIAARLGPTMR